VHGNRVIRRFSASSTVYFSSFVCEQHQIPALPGQSVSVFVQTLLSVFPRLIVLSCVFSLLQLLQGNPAPFAIMYTLGNILSICSTCFLFGPVTQAKSMCAMTRYDNDKSQTI
jgi:hypothetical protein